MHNAQLYCSAACRKSALIKAPFVCGLHGALRQDKVIISNNLTGVTVNIKRSCKLCHALRSRKSRAKIKANKANIDLLKSSWR